jgi:hypothetical protein
MNLSLSVSTASISLMRQRGAWTAKAHGAFALVLVQSVPDSNAAHFSFGEHLSESAHT